MVKHPPVTHPLDRQRGNSQQNFWLCTKYVHMDSQAQEPQELGPNKFTETEDKLSYLISALLKSLSKNHPFPSRVLVQFMFISPGNVTLCQLKYEINRFYSMLLSSKIQLDCSETAPNTISQNSRIKYINIISNV